MHRVLDSWLLLRKVSRVSSYGIIIGFQIMTNVSQASQVSQVFIMYALSRRQSYQYPSLLVSLDRRVDMLQACKLLPLSRTQIDRRHRTGAMRNGPTLEQTEEEWNKT